MGLRGISSRKKYFSATRGFCYCLNVAAISIALPLIFFHGGNAESGSTNIFPLIFSLYFFYSLFGAAFSIVLIGPFFELKNISDKNILIIFLSVISVFDSIVLSLFFYNISSADYPFDAYRIIMTITPFFLSALICYIF